MKHNLSEFLPNIQHRRIFLFLVLEKNSISLFIREVTEIQKRGQVGVVHDDDDDGEVPEVHDRAVQMHSEDQQQVQFFSS